jgi:hypothetical protein
MNGIPENLDWVSRRAQCSITKLFETLRLQIEGDVSVRNESLSARHQAAYHFGMTGDNNAFAVYFEDFSGQRTSIVFSIKGESIEVRHNERALLTAKPTISDDGKCRLKVDGVDRELWQVRKSALEDLFFPSFIDGKTV